MIQIVDFYVDEPACLGVPPYFSPYCRYIAGALVDAGVSAAHIRYLTVDQWRENGRVLCDEPELVVLVAGVTVPGRYLGGRIGTVADILSFLSFRRRFQKGSITLIGGPVRHAPPEMVDSLVDAGGLVVMGDLEAAVDCVVRHPGGLRQGAAAIATAGNGTDRIRFRSDYSDVDRWAAAGAFITEQHPNFPYLMLEMETYRGCTRRQHCSFCTESFYGRPVFRRVDGVLQEIRELYQLGNRYFRLGRQPDLLTYGADLDDCRRGFPRPRPAVLSRLYGGIRSAAPGLKVLHLDNINPGAMAAFEPEAAEIMRIISEHNTAGDTAAMGLETADPALAGINGLKCSPQEALRAIEIVNRHGGYRDNGIPKLLPGLNLIRGLPGESDKTFERNFRFLKSVLERSLLLRRINIRQLTIHPGTRAEHLMRHPDELKGRLGSKKHHRVSVLEKKFVYYRDRIRKEIDRPMLKAVFPPGTILREVILETETPGYILGRQLGSYPVTVKIPVADPVAVAALKNRRPLTVMVTGYRERSVLGLSWPIPINRLGQPALSLIPGIGAKRATRIFLARPLNTMAELLAAAGALEIMDEAAYSFERKL